MIGQQRLPGFVIAGAQKCGTSSLHHSLKLHENIFMSEPKEINFFHIDANYEKGLAWYSSFFKDWKTEKIAGESSPDYFCHRVVPQRLARALPHAKIIVILRNPVDRTYSAYWHAVRYGYETLSFEKALAAEPERCLSRNSSTDNLYVGRGMYAEQLRRFLSHFDRSQLMVVISEEYFGNPEFTLIQVANFLGVEPHQAFLDKARNVIRNIAKVPRSIMVQRYYRSLENLTPLAAKVLARLNLKRASYPPMPRLVRKALLDRFAESNAELEGLLGRQLNCWKR
jgi:hypothetical protein